MENKIDNNESEKINVNEMEIEDNRWYAVNFGRKTWVIKRIGSVLFGFKIDESYYSKREQKKFVKFAEERYLYPVIVYNKFKVDDIIYIEININAKYKKGE